MTEGPRRTKRAATLSVLVALAVALTGCSSSATKDTVANVAAGVTAGATATATANPIEVTVTPAAKATKVRLDEDVIVSTIGGTLTSVTVKSKAGSVKGELNDDATGWQSTGTLRASSKYTVKALVKGTDGTVTTKTSTFTTLKPSKTVSAYVLPSAGATVGVGAPIVVHFSSTVKNKKAVIKALKVTTAKKITGAWHWVSSVEVQYRPKTYWPANTKVKVSGDLRAVELKKGTWGSVAIKKSFTIGSSMISTVDVKADTLTVRKNGKVIKVIPITTGRPGYLTRNGVKVIMTRETTRRMDAATTGVDPKDPNYYNIVVHYAMRLTYSGEFLHAAPWSVASQGHANVSHGCTGMSMANAKWMFDHSKVGDVVVYVHSTRKLEAGNGWTLWNTSWKNWKSA